jgi:hypothetical protein
MFWPIKVFVSNLTLFMRDLSMFSFVQIQNDILGTGEIIGG